MSPVIQTVQPTTFATTCSMREWHSTQNVSRKTPVAEPCADLGNSFCVGSESKPIRQQVTTGQAADQFFNFSEDYTMIIHRLLPAGDEMLDVYHSFVTYVVELFCRTNIFMAIYTTAESGIHLYREGLLLLQDRVLCMNGLRHVYRQPWSDTSCLLRGKYLGQFKNELEGDPIIYYIGLGPKDYVYVTRGGKHCPKARGFSQNYRNNDVINFKTKNVKRRLCCKTN